jgi:colicin import membrane protein
MALAILNAAAMPRKLKTYTTNLGFFELAIAAPSMKAALEAWGMTHNAFQHGFAKQTDDPALIAQTNAKPGVVLKRGVGTSGPFSEDAELPDTLPTIKPPASVKLKRAPKPKASKGKQTTSPKTQRASVISFEKARREREKQRVKEDAELARERAKRRAATDEAESALADAQEAHDRTMGEIDRQREKLDLQTGREERRWAAEKEKLENAIKRARK